MHNACPKVSVWVVGVLPALYTLQGEVKLDDQVPRACGGFSEIWCSSLGPQKVVVKVIKVAGITDPRKLKKVCMGIQP